MAPRPGDGRRMRATRIAALTALLLSSSAAAVATDAPTPQAIPEDIAALVQRFVDTVDGLAAYEVVMSKQQRIDGKLKPLETVQLKHRRSPECRYLKWIAPPHQGREAILCSERYDGKLQVHEAGLLGLATLSLDPNGALARGDNLRPLAQAGTYNMARMLKADIERRRSSGQIEAPQTLARTVDGHASLCLRQHGGAGDPAPYPVGAAELCFDRTTAMPTEVQFWHRDGQLMEHYRFRDWQLSPTLSDADFDTANKAYGY